MVQASGHRIPGTRLFYDDDDVSEGRLSFIVSGKQGLDRLKDDCRGSCEARVTDTLDLVDSVVVDVPLERAAEFVKSLPSTSQAWVDGTINFDGPHGTGILASTQAGPTPPPANKPEVDREVIHLDQAWARGFTGQGVNIAVIDSGLWPHADLKNRIVAFKDMADGKTEPYDNYGHGTQVAGCAAGDGTRSQGRIKGAAPAAGLVGVRITSVSEAIAGLQWVIENKDRLGIRVVNMSLGDAATQTFKTDPWAQAAEKAVKAGLIVVVSSGNEGTGHKQGSISTPGIDPEVITVGAMDTHKTRDTKDDGVAEFSSLGPTPFDKIMKPDLVAPGVDVFGPLVPNSKKDNPSRPHVGRDYIALDGSSQAAPFVSGVAALMLQANPKLTQADVKDILTKTAQRYLPEAAYAQGAGVLDAAAAVDEALRRKTAAA